MKKLLCLFFMVLLCMMTIAALADEEEPQTVEPGPGYTIVKDVIGLKVDSSGRMTQIEDEVIRLENKNGIERFGQVVRLYNSDRQEVEVAVARTILPDGKSIQVSSTGIKDSEYPGFRKSRLYHNLRVRTITFPELKNGCSIAYRIETKCKYAYPGEPFWETSYTGDYGEMQESTFFAEIPRNRSIHFLTPGHNGLVKPRESLSGNTRTYFWQFKHTRPIEQEIAMPPLQELTSKVMVSSFSSWNEVGSFINELMKNHMQLNDDIKTRIQKVAGNGTAEEKVKKIFSWLIKGRDIVEIGLGGPGYDFKDVSDVYGEKSISSRDFTLLLLTVLKEAGIEAYPVLVSSYSYGNMNRELPTIQQFDTIVLQCRVDGRTLWIDTQDSDIRPGNLSSDLQGRPALVIKGNECAFEETPLTAFYTNREEARGEMVLSADGSVDGLIWLREYGVHKLQWMRIYNSIQETDRGNLARILLGHMDPRAMLVNYHYRENSSDGSPFSFKTHFRINNFGKKEGATWEMNIPLFTGSGISDLLKIDPARRIYPVAVGTPFQEDKNIRFVIPDGFRLKQAPRDLYIENKVGSLQVLTHVSGSNLDYFSRLIIRKGSVPVEEVQSLITLLSEVNRASKEPILLEEKAK